MRRYSSARDILKKGFEQIGSSKTHAKTPAALEKLVAAGKELGIPKETIKAAYDSVTPGVAQTPRTTPETRRLHNKFDQEMFGTPSPQDFSRAFEYDDLPSAAHIQLEEHRDLRSLVRSAAYELPLLAQYRQEYRPPTKAQNLRFKYNAFVQEDHPAAKKVVLEFDAESTGLKGDALHKLKLLAGPRFDAASGVVKIACDKFPDQTQNKRFLGVVYKRLLESAQDEPAAFKDVELDPRPALRRAANHKSLYPKHEFPAEWNRPDKAPKKREDILAALSLN